MAYFTETHARPESAHARAVLRLSQWMAGVAEGLERQRVARSTYNELSQLSDRDLADIGIARSQIRTIALEAANDKF